MEGDIMRKKIRIILLIALSFIMFGCSQYKTHEISKKEFLNDFKKFAGDGYKIHVFIEKNPIPEEVDVLWDYNKYENWTGTQIYRAIDGESKANYLESFGEESYPFYLVVSKNGIELQTNSIDEVVNFYEKFGG